MISFSTFLGSKEERDAVHRAHRYSQNPREDAYDIPEADVDFKLDVSDSVVIGKPIDIKVGKSMER